MQDDNDIPFDEIKSRTQQSEIPLDEKVARNSSFQVSLGNDDATVEISLVDQKKETSSCLPFDTNHILSDLEEPANVDEDMAALNPMRAKNSQNARALVSQKTQKKSGTAKHTGAANGVIPKTTETPKEQAPSPTTFQPSATGETQSDESQDEAKNNDRFGWCKDKLPWILVAILLIVLVAILGGVLGSQAATTSKEATATGSNTLRPTLAPSATPSQALTSVHTKVEAILQPYAPLDQDALMWLTETSTWQPERGAPNYEYQWFERYALALFYISTNGYYWKTNEHWMSDLPTCEWYSLEWNDCPGPVTRLVLPLNELRGSLPDVLFELTALTKIHLPGNFLIGSIPDSIANLQNLNHLDLTSNQMSGRIPSKFRRMPNLRHLYLSDNQFSSSLPIMIGDLSGLRALDLSDNQLTGRLPRSIVRMINLSDLSLHKNFLSGSLPDEIGNLYKKLTRLSLNDNQLTGTIPTEIAQLSWLRWLSLFGNDFGGPVPPLPDNPEVDLSCFFDECYTDLYYAQFAGCVISGQC